MKQIGIFDKIKRGKFIAFCLALCVVIAGSLVPITGALGSPGATISGKVYNVINNAPLVGATVTVGSLSAVTDTNGNYVFTNVPTGTHDLSASFSAFRSRTINGLPISEGQNLTQNIALTPSSTEVGNIGGYVINAMSGTQLVGAKVSLGDGMVKHTDGNGWYGIDNVPIGYPYTIVASAYAGYLSRSVGPMRANEGMDFALMPEGFSPGNINGRVTRSDNGAGVAEVWVRGWVWNGDEDW